MSVSKVLCPLLVGVLLIGWLAGNYGELTVSESGLAKQLESVDPAIPIQRRPIRVLLDSAETRLIVANRRSGSVSLLDSVEMELVGEWRVAESIGDLVWWKEDLYLLTDRAASEIVCLKIGTTEDPMVLWRNPTVGAPGSIFLHDGLCVVGGLWSRRVALHELTADSATLVEQADVPFAVGQIVGLDSDRAILACDAFGDHWASFRTTDLTPILDGRFSARRVGAVARLSDRQKLAFAVQPLNRLAQAVRNDVHWGLMVGNEIAIRDEQSFLQPDWKESRRSSIPLGGPGEAKGDPESAIISSRNEIAVAIGGVNEVAIGDLQERSFAYVGTGKRPVDCCFSKDGLRLFVANQVDDSITVVNVDKLESEQTVKLGRMPELTSADRGEILFFDANVSHDGWMSCHSCHVAGHTSGFLNDNFSDQSFGAPKRVLSLLGHGSTEPFAWNGSAVSLEDQIKSSIEITMQTDDQFEQAQIDDLAAFVRQLPAPEPLATARNVAETELTADGKQLFAELGCVECHAPPSFTSPELQDVGLADELGKREFNPPSLIGVSQRQAFFHDARYTSLRDVFVENKHQLKVELTKRQLDSLVDYLMRL